MKIVCVKEKSFFNSLTEDWTSFIVGVIYSRISRHELEFCVYEPKSDEVINFGDMAELYKYFIPLEEYRNIKINEILS